ncbi:MAG: hypothetical protein AAB521_03320 [Patescibacteria group bacterium]
MTQRLERSLPFEFRELPEIVQQRIEGVASLRKEETKGPHTVAELNQLLSQVDQLMAQHFDALSPFLRLENIDRWHHAWRRAFYGKGALETVEKSDRGKAWQFHEKSYMYGSQDGNYESSIATAAGRWETISDQDGFEKNPALPLLKIYKSTGLKREWRNVIVNGDEQAEMLVLRGPLNDVRNDFRESMDAVLLYRADGPLSNEVTYVVDPHYDLSAIKPLKPSIRIM